MLSKRSRVKAFLSVHQYGFFRQKRVCMRKLDSGEYLVQKETWNRTPVITKSWHKALSAFNHLSKETQSLGPPWLQCPKG